MIHGAELDGQKDNSNLCKVQIKCCHTERGYTKRLFKIMRKSLGSKQIVEVDIQHVEE